MHRFKGHTLRLQPETATVSLSPKAHHKGLVNHFLLTCKVLKAPSLPCTIPSLLKTRGHENPEVESMGQRSLGPWEQPMGPEFHPSGKVVSGVLGKSPRLPAPPCRGAKRESPLH
jgi:hypothetical protein